MLTQKPIRILSLVLAFYLLILSGPWMVKAATDDANACSLSIQYQDSSSPIPGAEFRVYHVASVLSGGQGYEWDARFEGCHVDWQSDMTNADWVEAAKTMVDFVEEQALCADAEGSTDANGIYRIPHLSPGLYLVIGSVTDRGTSVYQAQPFCVILPEARKVSATARNVVAEVKYETEPKPVTTEPSEETATEATTPSAEEEGKVAGSVQTGDETHPGVWVVLLIGSLSAAGMAAKIVARRKRQED